MSILSSSDMCSLPGTSGMEEPRVHSDLHRLTVLRIQRTCVHDGPGIRTTLFFRGCNLRCLWCQNPEAVSFRALPEDASYSVDDLMDIVARDLPYYKATGGGVTLSGGDPLLQDAARLIPFLEALREAGIHVAAETSLHMPVKHLAKLAPYVNLFLVDLKVVGDEEQHKRCTGRHSQYIQENIRYLVEQKANIRFRMVIVPGFNNSNAQIQAAAELLKRLGYASIELLKYHNLYEEKAKRLGLEQQALGIPNEQAVAALREAAEAFARCGIQVECQELDASRHRAQFSARVHAIQDAIRNSKHSLCFEVSTLKTEFYKKNGFDMPASIHRARRLEYVLQRKKVIVYPQELLVGNFTSKRRGGQVWEEHCGSVLGLVAHQIHKQKPVPFDCSWKDRAHFFTQIMPFWLRHGLLTKGYGSASGFAAGLAHCADLSTGFNNNLSSIAHFVVNYYRVLECGTTGLIQELEEKKQQAPEETRAFYEGSIIALRALETFGQRYGDELDRLSIEEEDSVRRCELEEMAAICRHVPKYPARTYHEALQSMMFLHIALCIESFENAVSPGRLDQILYPYYKRDLEAGILTYERARELLALFVLKLDEAILVNDGNTFLRISRLFETMSTDQTITAGGVDSEGRDATNDLTYALLDICELQPYAANMTARIHEGSPQEYLDRLAEVYINGSPMPALYNDSVYLETLQKHYATSVEQARNYAIIGCVEPNASDDHFGNTDCANMNVCLPLLQALRGDESDLWNVPVLKEAERVVSKAVEYLCVQKKSLPLQVHRTYTRGLQWYQERRKQAPNPPQSMEELLERYQARLNQLARSILKDHQAIEAAIRKDFSIPLTSALYRGCVQSGRDANEGGTTFNSSGIQAVGITDVADSLHAIDEVVFKRGLYSLPDLLEAMEHNFQGERYAPIQRALLAVPKFGQDESAEAVRWVNRTLDIYVTALRQVPDCPRNGIYAAGYYALNVNDMYGKKTPALPSGRLAGVPLANSITPHYGMQSGDLLSALNSVAGVDFAQYAPNGTTVTFTIDSALFQGPDGVRNLASIFKTFFQMGGMQLQPNVINREILLDAYEHPEKYPNLLVRVAGYCAYFNHLSDDLKKIIINRTCYS